mmetsp:Transcript_8254/g.7661  ORF Transcript_8254/g.7661 Transcript_8254/m.7661 type:complete len:101 (-) Transcript_8254:338-640(-)
MVQSRMFSSLNRRKNTKTFGVLGLDPIQDEESKIILSHYQDFKDSMFSKKKKSMDISTYPYELNRSLFQPKVVHERVKSVFKRFDAALEQEMKEKDLSLL